MSVTDFGDPDQIIHIPARDLTGPREAKLAELDMLLAQLQMGRLVSVANPFASRAFSVLPATSGSRLAQAFLVRAEFRRDWSSLRFFPGPLGSDDLRHGQNTALVGGVWWFGTKEGVW